MKPSLVLYIDSKEISVFKNSKMYANLIKKKLMTLEWNA